MICGTPVSASMASATLARISTTTIAVIAALAAVAVAVAVGAIAVPDLAGALRDATDSIGGWIYLAVPALVFLETTALVGFVIHGELVLMVGGVAAERGDASLPVIIVLVAAAAVAGDCVSLLLGRWVRLPIGADRVARVEAFFARHGGKALFLGRFTGFLRATMPFVAGSSGVPLRRLLPYSLASAVVWTVTFTLIGYAFSETFADAGEVGSRIALIGLLVIVGALLIHSRWTAGRNA